VTETLEDVEASPVTREEPSSARPCPTPSTGAWARFREERENDGTRPWPTRRWRDEDGL
jgi:hypothetical protein